MVRLRGGSGVYLRREHEGRKGKGGKQHKYILVYIGKNQQVGVRYLKDAPT